MKSLDHVLILIFGLAVFGRVSSLTLAASSTTPSPSNNDDDDDWDDEDSSEVEDDGKVYKNPRNSPSSQCPRDEEQATLLGQKCLRKCFSDEDCKSKKKKCLCDGACGMSCIKPDRECTEPEQIPFGNVQTSGRLFGARASYSCQHGYHVVGLQNRNCQGDGQWAGQAPACKQNIYCLSPPTIDHARHNALPEQATFDLDSTLQYYCHTGYVTNGFPRAKCLAIDGQASWYGPDISCEPRSCGAPPDVSHGWHAGECYTFGCRITYHCAESYELVGKNEKFCQSDGTWTPKEVPTCVLVTAVQCPPPENPRHGKAIYTSCSYNSVVRYECKYGYTLVGESTRRCGADRKWSGAQPVCKEINCGHPGRLWNGWLENIEGGTGLGASIIFRCHEGMLLEGNSSTVCQIDGKWRYPLPKCFAPCVVPQIIKGRVILLSRNDTAPTSTVVTHGEALAVDCEARYEFISQQEHVTCNNGTWTQMPKCEPAKCQNLPKSPKHGMVSAPDMKHGMKAKFRCKDGYEIKGNIFLECSFGNWTGQPPRCEEVFCPYPGLVQNGKILLVGNMALYDYRPYVKKVANNKQIMYDCEKGYVLLEGPPGATCIGGRWSPPELPRCVEAEHPRFRFNVRRRRSIVEKYKRAFIRNYQHVYENVEKRKVHHYYQENVDPFRYYVQHGSFRNREKKDYSESKTCSRPPQLLPYPSNDPSNFSIGFQPGFTIIFGCRNNLQLWGSPWTTCIDGHWEPSDIPICHQGTRSDLHAIKLVLPLQQRTKRDMTKQDDFNFKNFEGFEDQPLSRKSRLEILPLVLWKLLKLLRQQDPSFKSVIMPSWCAYEPNQTCNPRHFLLDDNIQIPKSNQHPDRVKRSEKDLQDILLHHDYTNISDLPLSRKPRVDGLPALQWYLTNIQKRDILKRTKRALSLGLRRYGDKKRNYLDNLLKHLGNALRTNRVSKRTLLQNFPLVYNPSLYVRNIRAAAYINVLLDQLRNALKLKSQHHKRTSVVVRTKRALKGGGGSRAVGLSRVGGSGGGHSVRRGNKGSNSLDEEDEIPDPDATVPSNTIKKPKTNKTRGGPCDPLQNEPYVNIEFVKHSKDQNSTWGTGTTVRLACGIGFVLNMAENQTAKCSKGKWKPKKPRCIIVPCYVPETPFGIYNIARGENVTDSDIDPFQPLNSTIGVPNGIVVEFSCEEGYAVQGSPNMKCWHGDWAVTAFPECAPAPCQLPKIYHGQYNSGYKAGLTIANGSSVTYQCDEEYIPTEEQNMECLLGELQPRHPICRRADGKDPPEDHYLGGGDLVKGGDITVIEYGNSNGKPCGPPAKVRGSLVYKNGEQIVNDENSFPDGSEVTFNCIESIMGEKTTWKIICEDGSWIGRSLNCDLEELMSAQFSFNNSTCIYRNQEPNLVSFYNDQMIKEDVVEFPTGAILVSRCVDIGKFALVGSNKRRCMGGDWDGVKPSCFGMNQYNDYSMASPPTILFRHDNGPIAQSNDGKMIVYPGTTLHMECLWIRRFGTPKWTISHDFRKYQEGWTTDEGRDSGLEYRLSIPYATKDDSGIFTCVTPARYTHSVEIVVKAVHCPTLPERRGLTASTKSTKMNTIVKFDCVNGNALIGAPEIICLPSGNWSAPFPVCESIECGEVTDLPAHLRVLIISREVGGKAAFSCDSGYGLRGPAETVCQHSGDWAIPFPTCQEVHCDDPKPPENGYIQGSGPYKAGDVVQFNCNPDYMMEGQPIIACQENSRWSGKNPKCIQACSYPGTTISGRMSSVKFFYKIGENITFSCEEGLVLKGAAMLKCLKNGKWSTAIPTCVTPESVMKRDIYYG